MNKCVLRKSVIETSKCIGFVAAMLALIAVAITIVSEASYRFGGFGVALVLSIYAVIGVSALVKVTYDDNKKYPC